MVDKLYVWSPVALAARETRLGIFVSERSRQATQHCMRDIIKRVDVDGSVVTTGNLAGGHWYDPALAADVKPGSLRSEGILGDKRAVLDSDL